MISLLTIVLYVYLISVTGRVLLDLQAQANY